MMADCTVVICTHNPCRVRLRRVLGALRQQTLPVDRWVVTVVDSASREPVADWLRLHDFGLRGKVMRADVAGLTIARVAGIRDARTELVVFVDDDALLDPHYLSEASAAWTSLPHIGAFGGNVELAFDSPPPAWTEAHWPRLAQRVVSRMQWSNFHSYPSCIPWGVGMCVRREVADAYVRLVESCPLRQMLDRSGDSLLSGGDEDLAAAAFGLGMGTALLPALKLTHLIPDSRLTLEYICRLIEGQTASGVILEWLWRGTVPVVPSRARAVLGKLRRRMTLPHREREFLSARLRGVRRGRDLLLSLPCACGSRCLQCTKVN